MVKKNLSRALATLLMACALALPGFVSAQQQTAPDSNSNRTGVSSLTPNSSAGVARKSSRPATRAEGLKEIEDSFSEALSLVEENYVDGNKVDYNAAFKSSIIGMLRVLDPHSNYYDSKEFEELRSEWRSEYFGIGATIGARDVDNHTDTYILATFENSPAQKAGLRFGDRIVEVDGQDMRGKSSDEVRDKMRGPRGTKVKVTVERAADNSRQTVEITRDAVAQPTVPDAYMIRPGVGYIDMRRGFNYTTGDEFYSALEYLHKQGATSLVLDLRDNPGGLLDQAVRVASAFLPRGQLILTQKGRTARETKPYKSDNDNPDTTPLAVLVNRGTASASEIVAGALQDHDRALVIGETSFGKGLVQSIIPLEYGSALTLTSSKYYTPSGRLIQRDYSNGSLYDYYTHGGVGKLNELDDNPPQPTGPQTRTDTGRTVYGGGGITPDEFVKPQLFYPQQAKLIDPIFAFARELVSGRVKGFESYAYQKPIDFDHELRPTDFPVTDDVFKAFKSYVAQRKFYNLSDAQLERNSDFIRRQLRYDLATAAYGTYKANRVLLVDEPQTAKAIESLPRAKELALAAARGRNPQSRSFE